MAHVDWLWTFLLKLGKMQPIMLRGPKNASNWSWVNLEQVSCILIKTCRYTEIFGLYYDAIAKELLKTDNSIKK